MERQTDKHRPTAYTALLVSNSKNCYTVTENLYFNIAAVQRGVTTKEMYSQFGLQLDD